MNKKFFVEAFKYGCVGVLNTLITAVVIGLMMRFVFHVRGDVATTSIALTVSNVVGYVIGLINSFIWNRKWTFKSKNGWKKEFVKFTGVFLICYIPQLLLINALNVFGVIPALEIKFLNYEYVISSAYLCQLIGIVFYTVLNFLCNKYYTFKN